mmetsp:Transcript_30222/g.59202  ORF Transcript_30222/g.59202 Transcript_30222/m.59202 type:complete len:479 (+) Transcript_30222:54-1490(+)
MRSCASLQRGMHLTLWSRSVATSHRSQTSIIQLQRSKGKKRIRLDHSRWSVRLSPDPSDLMWKNLSITTTEQFCRQIAINVGLFVAMALIIAPVAVIDRLDPLVQRLEDVTIPDKLSHREVRRFVGNYFPTLVVFVINFIMLPILIDKTSHLEGHHTESQRSAAVVKRNAVFQFVNTILLPSLALNSAAALVHLAYSSRFEDWEKIIGTSLQKNTSGRFFLIYLIHATLLGCASELAQVPQMAYNTLLYLNDCVARRRYGPSFSDEASNRFQWEFDFGYFYGARLTMLGLVLLYSVIVPIIAPVGAVYFLANYWTDSYNLRSGTYSIRFDSNGQLPLAVLRYMLWYVALFLVTMSCYFTVQGTYMFFLLGLSLIMVGVIVLCSTMLWWTTRDEICELDEDDDFIIKGQLRFDTKKKKKKNGGKGGIDNARDRATIHDFLQQYQCPFKPFTRDRSVAALHDPTTDDHLQLSPGQHDHLR